MAAVDVARGRRSGGQGWLSTLLGIGVLVTVGFVLGLVFGVVSQEPELVVGHVTGRSEQIDWTEPGPAEPPPSEPLYGGSDLAAAPPPLGASGEAGPGASVQPVAPTRAPASPQAPPPARRTPDVAAKPSAAAGASPRSEVASATPDQPPFAIQVGAFSDGGAAERVAADLRGKGYPVRVIGPGQDDRWRVRVGPIVGRPAADETAHRLKTEEQLPTWVLRERGG